MKLYSVEITAEERAEQGFARLLNEALHAVENAYMQACVNQRKATIRIVVSAVDPDEDDDIRPLRT